MWSTWWQRLQQRRDERLLRQRPIPEPLWLLTLARFPFLGWRSKADLAELRRLATLFLARKEFCGAHGFQVSDEMAVAVAAQACLPVLRLGLDLYDGFVGIVMHRDEVIARREVTDEVGVVHRYDELLAGEAMDGGPVMLSWRDVSQAGESAGLAYNVVVHEFVHVLDLLDGQADGTPPLPSRAQREHWIATMEEAYTALCDEVDAGHATFLDPYGTEGPDEFFAVAAEAFFVAPRTLTRENPPLYQLLSDYFRQDPARHPAAA